VNEIHTGYVSNRILKIQVGFLLADAAGQSRDVSFDVPQKLRIADDLTVDNLYGDIHLSRTSRGILLQGEIQTQIEGLCARCLDATTIDLEVPLEELFVYPPEPGEESVLADDGILDIAPLLREEIFLNMPIGALCKSDCAGLCPNCGQNLNEGPCDCEAEPIDPRFAALKALKDASLED